MYFQPKGVRHRVHDIVAIVCNPVVMVLEQANRGWLAVKKPIHPWNVFYLWFCTSASSIFTLERGGRPVVRHPLLYVCVTYTCSNKYAGPFCPLNS